MYLSLLSFSPSITKKHIQELIESNLLSDDLRNTLKATSNTQERNEELNEQFLVYIKDFADRRKLDISIFPEELINL
jgi:hypothetical protein